MPSLSLGRKKIEIDPTKIYVCLSSYTTGQDIAKTGERRHGGDAMVRGWPESWAPDGMTDPEQDALHLERFGTHRPPA